MADEGPEADARLQALIAKSEFLELLMSGTQDGIVDWDLVTGKATYNQRWRYLLGFDAEELSDTADSPELWRSLVHPAELDETLRALDDHLQQSWPFTSAVRMRYRTGGYRHILCRGTAHRDADDRPVRMVIIFSDIDEQIRGEARQRALIAALPDTLFRVRPDGTVVGLKRGIEREGSPFSGLREGTTLADSLAGEARRRLEFALARLRDEFGSAEARNVQITTTTPAGPVLHHEVRIVRSDDDEAVCIVRDVTEQRDLEERLLQTQKLGAIGQLAAGVAHEINTPMQYIGDNLHFAKGAIQDLLGLIDFQKRTLENALGDAISQELARAEADADFAYARINLPKVLEQSLAGVERVTKIVRALKTFSHPGGQLAPTNLQELIESAVMVSSNEWKYVADVDFEFDATMPAVPCISGELNQVVLNLIVNAAHAIADVVGETGEKGRIVITTRHDATHAELRISDTGSGIPEHARSKIFDPFFTTKEVGKGTGQGLSMAYNCIVKRHNGTIQFDTELGRGTSFSVRLPLDASGTVASGLPP